MPCQASLFPVLAPTFAHGFFHEPNFLTWAEETALLEEIQKLPLAETHYRQLQGRRQVVSYGGRCVHDINTPDAAEPIPEFLHPLRERVAQWAGRPVAQFTHALVEEYSPGTPLGWHREAPNVELVVGVSLMSACRMRFRRYPPKAWERFLALELAAGSIYRMEDEARWQWQHSVPAVRELRYSIAFRTHVQRVRD